MVSKDGGDDLGVFLDKQREARRLSEELQQLQSSKAVEAAINIRHEIEALMADYDLSAEQMLEALCTLFDLVRPVGYVGSELVDRSRSVGLASKSQGSVEVSGSKGQRSPRSEAKKASKNEKSGRDKAIKTAATQVPLSNHSLVRSKRVTIRTPEERLAATQGDGAHSENAEPAKSVKGRSARGKADKTYLIAPALSRRTARVYTNPHTGKTIRTRGVNHRILNQWRAEYGQDVVDQWLIQDDAKA